MLKKQLIKIFALVIALSFSNIAGAVVIQSGLDRFLTVSAMHPLPIFGITPFKGFNILGLGSADTIVERIDDTPDLNPGDTGTVNIEMLALSLMSVDPFELAPGSFFDIFIILDLGDDLLQDTGDETSSTGTMDITLNGTSDGGTFDSILNVFADAFFVPVGINPANIVDIVNNAIILSGQADVSLDITIPLLASTSCSWGTGGTELHPSRTVPCEHLSPNGDGHTILAVPEPTTLALAFTGLSLLGLRRRHQKTLA